MTVKTAELEHYIQSILGFGVRLSKAKLNVSFSTQESFRFFKLDICPPNGAPLKLLAAIQHEDEYPGIVALRKRLAVIEKATERVVVYVADSISSVERRSLIDRHINFIAVGRQFFVPELAMDLREAFRIRKKSLEQEIELSPATQAILIRMLYERWEVKTDNHYTARDLMGSYKYSRVTLSKAISELTKAGILHLGFEQTFATRLYTFTASRADTLRKALLMMRSPIKRRVMVNRKPALGNGVCHAGDTALAAYTMLAPSSRPVFAMTQKVYSALLENGELEEVSDIDSAKAAIEIWSYRSPRASTNVVDEISLYLSLKDNPDERVQIALSELEENHSWMRFVD